MKIIIYTINQTALSANAALYALHKASSRKDLRSIKKNSSAQSAFG